MIRSGDVQMLYLLPVKKAEGTLGAIGGKRRHRPCAIEEKHQPVTGVIVAFFGYVTE